MSIKNNFTTTYHPQSNGQVERYNRTILAARRTYVSDHPRDWDLYTDALTYEYSCQPHTSTSVAPFDLVLSKPPGPIALKPIPSREEPTGNFKRKWKHWLVDTMKKTKERLDKAKARYEKNYDARLRNQSEVIHEDDYVFLRVERKNPKDHRHKLAPVAEGPFQVTKVDGNTVNIEKAVRSVETVSRSRVVLAPKPASEDEVEKFLKPIDLPEEIASEKSNMNDIVASNDKEDNETAKQTEGIDAKTPEATQEGQTKKNDDEENETEEHVMDSIVDDKVNKSRRHR